MNADTVIKHVNLATFAADGAGDGYGVIPNGLLAIKSGKIIYAGTEADAPQFIADELVDGKGGWLTPGLIDCHTHIVYAGSRSDEFEALQQGETYAEIAKKGGGIQRTVSATRAASEDELFNLARGRALCLMREGVTHLEVKSGYGLNAETELKMLRVVKRLQETLPITFHATCLAAHTVPKEFKDRPDAYIDHIISEVLPIVKAENLASAVDVFCESIAFNSAQTKKLLTAAKQMGFRLKGHVEQLSQQHGTDVLCELDALSADHIEYIDDTQVQKMADANVAAVLLPGAFYFLKETQKPPISSLRAHKVPMAIATDANPGSAPLFSILTAANFACVHFQLTPLEAWEGITKHAASALGIGETTGQLLDGFEADVLLWQVDHPRKIIHELNRHRPTTIWKKGQKVTHA